MTTLLDPAPPQDYAPEPPRRGVGRGRKALIGLMAIAAVGAVSGGGTFASFSASTDNSATNAFRTAKFELGNNVEDSATQCLSSGAEDIGANATTCEALFTDLVSANTMLPGTTYKTGVVIQNTGDSDGHLYVHAKATCAKPSARNVNLCDKIKFRIQEYAVGGTPGAAGTGAVKWDDTSEQFVSTGADGNVGGGDDTALTAVSYCVYDSAEAITTNAACQATGGDLSDFPVLANKLDADDAVLAFANTPLNNDLRFFHVEAILNDTSTVGGSCVSRSGTGADPDYSTAGIGCANDIADGGADFVLRWLMQES